MWAISLPSPTSDSPTINELPCGFSSWFSGGLRIGEGAGDSNSAANGGQAGAARQLVRRRRRPFVPPTRSPARRSWPACSRSARRSPATSPPATTSTTPPTRTCRAARSRSGRSWGGRASAAWGRRCSRRCGRRGRCAGANTNLGIALLLAPLARAALAPAHGPLRPRVAAVLASTTLGRRPRGLRGDPPRGRRRPRCAGGARRPRRAARLAARRHGRGGGARRDRRRVRERLHAHLRGRAAGLDGGARRRAAPAPGDRRAARCGCSPRCPTR